MCFPLICASQGATNRTEKTRHYKRSHDDLAPRLTKLICALFAALSLASPSAFASELPQPIRAEDVIAVTKQEAELGQLLFYDRILSGNRNIACSTCHHPDFGTTDGLSLGIGEGGVGLGPMRRPGSGPSRIHQRVRRNAPGLWNLGAKELHTLFHDGRLSVSTQFDSGFDSPAQSDLPSGLNNLLAAQALFALTSPVEMAGDRGENRVAEAVRIRIDHGWPIIANRVRNIDEYAALFIATYPHIETSQDINITDIANALSAFQIFEWTSFDSPFDHYLEGKSWALDPRQKAGMALFYGKARCSSCHRGTLFSDQQFHALALPNINPSPMGFVDRGAEQDPKKAGRFRTPMLRNVDLTAPYGHNGAFPTLEGIIRHHLDPAGSLQAWSVDMAQLPEIPWLSHPGSLNQEDEQEFAFPRALGTQIRPQLNETEIDELIGFLEALTGTSAHAGVLGIPERVPSGLAVDGSQNANPDQ